MPCMPHEFSAHGAYGGPVEMLISLLPPTLRHPHWNERLDVALLLLADLAVMDLQAYSHAQQSEGQEQEYGDHCCLLY